MDELSAIEASKYLGITREAVDLAARDGRLSFVADGGPRRFTQDAVEEYHQLRQSEKIATLARSGETPVSAARKVRERLHASSDTGLPRSHASKLTVMPESWRSLFNKAELAAAGVKDGCRWCKSLEYSAFFGLRPVELADAYVELFGGQPCEVCGPGLRKPLMEAASRRVHPGRKRPPDARAEAAAAVPPAPRPQPARPVQGGDGGRALVARRRREVQARLKTARRSGDTAYALQLQATLQALTADAAAVDYGRTAVTASSRPGTLRCGHALAAGCACPRRASTRGQR